MPVALRSQDKPVLQNTIVNCLVPEDDAFLMTTLTWLRHPAAEYVAGGRPYGVLANFVHFLIASHSTAPFFDRRCNQFLAGVYLPAAHGLAVRNKIVR